jgi:type IV secretory pathway VirB10-like protein
VWVLFVVWEGDVVRFQSRAVLAGSTLAVFAASSGVALLMPAGAAEPAVGVPEFAASQESLPAVPDDARARPVAPPVTGAQIAALAIAPARDRAEALIAERAKVEAEAEAAREKQAERDDDEADSSDRGGRSDEWRELRKRIKEACDDGRIRGQICRG